MLIATRPGRVHPTPRTLGRRALRTVTAMVISYVVRLRPDALADGRFVGEVEAVTSRQRTRIRTLEQLAAFILATMPTQVSSSSAARQLATEEDDSAGGLSATELIGGQDW